jgi:predicted ribosomally synthesized peptide with nif11-like leader
MSKVSPIAEFVAKMARDEELSARVAKATASAASREEGVQAVVAIAKEQGFEIDGKELEQAIVGILQPQELSDKDLEQVAGGLNPFAGDSPAGPWTPQNIVIIYGWAVAREVIEDDGDGFWESVGDAVSSAADEIADKAKDAVDVLGKIFSGW